MDRDNFIPFLSNLDAFHFISILNCSGENYQNTWVAVARGDILVLLLILSEGFQSFISKYDISYGFFVDATHYLLQNDEAIKDCRFLPCFWKKVWVRANI